MTCIVGIEHNQGVTIAGDSRSTSGWYANVVQWKAFELGDLLIGCCGGPRTAQLVRYRLVVPPLDIHDVDRWIACEFADAVREVLKESGAGKVNAGVDEMDGSSGMLVAVAGRLYTLHSDFQWSRNVCGYQAIGSGRELATGSLHTTAQLQLTPTERAQMAVQAACDHSASCGPPVVVMEHAPERNWRNT